MPGYISIKNPKYLEIDNNYYSGLIVIDYSKENEDIILKSIINENINIRISLFYEKKDKYKSIRELTRSINIMTNQTRKESEDIDLMAYTKNDAKYIRSQMQINNEDLYNLYMYVIVFSDDLEILKNNLNILKGLLESRGMTVKSGNFRNDEIFKTTLPLGYNPTGLKNAARRNILTSGLVSTYPFILSNIFDKSGIFLGKSLFNNSNIFFDRFQKEKYKNSNMCIFGTSGSGKSFFVKIQILREYLRNIKQYIIDPEREYDVLCKNLGGQNIILGPDSDTYVNIMDIREESIEGEKGYLNSKLLKLKSFFYLIFEDMKQEDYAILERNIINTYKKYGINFDDKSLFNKGKFKSQDDMPILEDLYNEIIKNLKSIEKNKSINSNEYKILNSFKNKLEIFVKGSLSFFNHKTNIELKNNFIVADIYSIGDENYKYAMFLFTEIFWDKIKKDRTEKKIIYIDEIWRIIGVTSNKETASFIFKIFKTIRKYSGAAVAITQDINDIFSLESGNYGKTILNNSETKVIFNLEEENINILGKNIKLSEQEKLEIRSLKKGEALLFITDTHLILKNIASDYEMKMVEKENENIISNK